jgi:hypothetical protein
MNRRLLISSKVASLALLAALVFGGISIGAYDTVSAQEPEYTEDGLPDDIPDPEDLAPPATTSTTETTMGSHESDAAEQGVQAAFDIAVCEGPIVIEVRATGAQEVPPVSTVGTAFARFTFDENTGTLDFFVTQFGFSANVVTAAHIHRGAVGVNGPIIHFISATGFIQASGRLQLSAADVADLKAGNLYLNVHSVDYPAGYARAQLFLPAC